MNLSRKDIELLAPAGSFESLMAAIQGGADAVYFGIGNLNMRSRSAYNFTRADLPAIAETAAKHGIKAYLTVNTVVYNHELGTARELVDLAKKYKLDAIIASDPSVLMYAFKEKVEVHLSTQLNISNMDSLKFYSSFADVAVLARELNLTQVAQIAEGIQLENVCGPSGKPIRLEMFIHGALCMAISGKCYLSLHEHGHSANRGDCFQVCRRSYIVNDKESAIELEVDNEYIMSPKDLSTIHFLNKITDAGVRVLKIEGRARGPEYVKTVTACYNEALTAIANGSYSAEKIETWKKRLSEVFNRGFWDGYYLGQRLGEWSHVYGSQATKKKVYLAKAMNWFGKSRVAEFLVEAGTLKEGDTVLITGPTTGVIEMKVQGLRVDDQKVPEAGKGSRCSFITPQTVRRSDKLYRLDETEFGSQLHTKTDK
jgi:putative protease